MNVFVFRPHLPSPRPLGPSLTLVLLGKLLSLLYSCFDGSCSCFGGSCSCFGGGCLCQRLWCCSWSSFPLLSLSCLGCHVEPDLSRLCFCCGDCCYPKCYCPCRFSGVLTVLVNGAVVPPVVFWMSFLSLSMCCLCPCRETEGSCLPWHYIFLSFWLRQLGLFALRLLSYTD